MASEATILELINGGETINFTCADATGISKGTLLEITGDNTVTANTGEDIVVGIAAADKEANDGATRIGAHTHGIFDVWCDATGVTLGDPIAASGANLIGLGNSASFGNVIGKALETGSASEKIRCLIRI